MMNVQAELFCSTASESAVECSDCGCAFVNADAYDLHIIGSKCVLPYEARSGGRETGATWTRPGAAEPRRCTFREIVSAETVSRAGSA